MKHPVIFFMHVIVALAAISIMIMQAIGLSGYYHEPIIFNLLDSFLSFGSFLSLFYISYYLFIPQYLIKKQYWKFILIFILIISCFTLYYNLVAIFVFSVLKTRFHLFVKLWWHGLAIYAIVLLVMGSVFRIITQWIMEAQEKTALQLQNFKSELSLLKSQLNPHFLFNTLNNIDSLINEKSPNASLALNKLSDIMRYVVYDSEKDMVPLQDEIDYIENYISLQKLRMPNEEIVDLTLNGNFNNIEIPPMLFIPFVENAFKHSSFKDKPENKIEIKIDVQGKELLFLCSNSVTKINNDKSSGIGLDLVKRRLELIYKNNYHLTINNSLKEYSVILKIKLA